MVLQKYIVNQLLNLKQYVVRRKMKKFGGEKLGKREFLSSPIQISFKHTIVIQAKIIQSIQLKHITMKEEDLSRIKQ